MFQLPVREMPPGALLFRSKPANLANGYCTTMTFSDTDANQLGAKHLHAWVINPVHMGDYDTATSDVTGENAGLYNTFQIRTNGNPDVFDFKLPD